MGRNRSDVDRDAKLEEILGAAEDLLRAGGYAALSFAAVAERVGVARGAVYWYYPSKDELFVAVITRAFSRALADPPERAGYRRRIAWAVDRLADLQPLTASLHDRVPHDPGAAALEQVIQTEMCGRLRDVLVDEVPPERLDSVAMTVVIFVQGLLAASPSRRARNGHLDFLLDELIG